MEEEVAMEATQQPIVVGVDDSDGIRSALRWTANEAAQRGVPVRVVTAYHGVGGHAQRAGQLVADAVDRLHASSPGIVAEAVAVEGDPAQVMLDESKQASQVVLGPHHRKRSSSSALGSVGSAVTAHSQAPVVVLCGPAGMPEERAAVVIGVDGTDSSPDVLAVGFEHAHVHHVPVHAVLCWHTDLLASMSWRAAPPAPDSVHQWLDDELSDFRQQYPDVEVLPEVIRQPPKSALVKVSEEQFLLVIGNRGGHGRSGGSLGSVAKQVLHHATCPVAVIPTQRP
jgi:nucleotide-binding universal stress UspA family protein